MAERGKVSRYRRALDTLAAPAKRPRRRRKEAEGEAAKLGQEIHAAERAGKPRPLTKDTDVPYTPQRPAKR